MIAGRDMRTTLMPLLLLVTLVVVPSSTQAAPAVPTGAATAAAGDVHLTFHGRRGVRHHTIRFANGSWQPAGSLSAGNLSELTSTMVGGELHEFYIGLPHISPYYDVKHIVRYTDGTWNFDANSPDEVFAEPGFLGATTVNGLPHVVRLEGNRLWHSHQLADGTWPIVQGGPTVGDHPRDLAVTSVGSDVRVVVLAEDGRTVMRTDRHADGTWSPPHFTQFGGTATKLSAAQVGDDLHVVLLDDQFNVYHTIMREDLTWDPFRDVDGAAGDSGMVNSVGVTASVGTLHLVVGSDSTQILHSIRYPDRSWQPFGNVKNETGGPIQSGHPQSIAGQ